MLLVGFLAWSGSGLSTELTLRTFHSKTLHFFFFNCSFVEQLLRGALFVQLHVYLNIFLLELVKFACTSEPHQWSTEHSSSSLLDATWQWAICRWAAMFFWGFYGFLLATLPWTPLLFSWWWTHKSIDISHWERGLYCPRCFPFNLFCKIIVPTPGEGCWMLQSVWWDPNIHYFALSLFSILVRASEIS